MSKEDFIYEVCTLRRAARDGKKYQELLHDMADLLQVLRLASDMEHVREAVDHFSVKLDLRRGEESK